MTLIQQVLERVSKKKSKHAGSTSHSKDKECSDSDNSIRFHSPHDPDDKVEPPVKDDDQNRVEPEGKATNGDAGHRMNHSILHQRSTNYFLHRKLIQRS